MLNLTHHKSDPARIREKVKENEISSQGKINADDASMINTMINFVFLVSRCIPHIVG